MSRIKFLEARELSLLWTYGNEHAVSSLGGIDAPHLFIRLAYVIGQQTQSFLNRIKKKSFKILF